MLRTRPHRSDRSALGEPEPQRSNAFSQDARYVDVDASILTITDRHNRMVSWGQNTPQIPEDSVKIIEVEADHLGNVAIPQVAATPRQFRHDLCQNS
jgi:hypothetical protein